MVQITLPFDEALALGTLRQPLPPFIESVHCEGSTLHAAINLKQMPNPSMGMVFAAAAAGTVSVTARFSDYSAGVATFVVTATARGFAAHSLLPLFVDRVNEAINKSEQVRGLIEVRTGGDPVVLLNLQKAVESRIKGITITGFELRDATVEVTAEIAGRSG